MIAQAGPLRSIPAGVCDGEWRGSHNVHCGTSGLIGVLVQLNLFLLIQIELDSISFCYFKSSGITGCKSIKTHQVASEFD